MSQSYVKARVLRINVGYLLAQSPGFSRETIIDIPKKLRLDDITIEKTYGELRLTRTSEGILMQGVMNCTIYDICSRCLENTEISFPVLIEELFGTAPHHNTQFVIGEDNFIDLAPLLREEVLIGTPNQVLCKPDCKGLCPNCGGNLNEGACECEHEDIDPRWAALSQLKGKLAKDE